MWSVPVVSADGAQRCGLRPQKLTKPTGGKVLPKLGSGVAWAAPEAGNSPSSPAAMAAENFM
jgi:hypothetical protein